jgi:hypothetical protein
MVRGGDRVGTRSEPSLAVSTPLDECYTGEMVSWTVRAASASGHVKVQFLSADRVVAQQAGRPEARVVQGKFETGRLRPGIYRLQATGNAGAPGHEAAQREIILAPDPFDWPARKP